MRFTENVRGEWDELGERDARAVVPGPGPGEPAAGVPAGAQPVEEESPAGTQPSGQPGPVCVPPVPAVRDAGAATGPAPASPRESAEATATGAVPGQARETADVPERAWESGTGPGGGDAAPSPVDVEDIPADLGPALDAVAGVGRAPGGTPLDLGAALDLSPAPDAEPVAPPGKPRWGTGPVVASWRAPAAVATTGPAVRSRPRWGTGPVADPTPGWGPDPAPEPGPDPGARTASGPAPLTREGPAPGRMGAGDPVDPGTAVVPAADAGPVADLAHVPAPDGEPAAGAVTDAVPPSVTDTLALAAVPPADTAREAEPPGPGIPEPAVGGDGVPEAAPALPEDAGRMSDDGAPLPWGAAQAAGGLARPREGAAPRPERERARVTMALGAADPVDWWGAGRRQPVISTEATAPIPVHLLFRDDGLGAAAPGTTSRPGVRRPPVPRSPQLRQPGRPAPLADPRLAERPGPALPGWAALLTAAAGTAAGLAVLWWHGALPAAVPDPSWTGTRAYDGMGTGAWALIALLVAVVLFALGGLGRGRAGHASVLTLFGGYRGSVRRTGLLWISPLLRRRRVDVRLRHWRSEPLPAVDASGTALRAVVLVVWRVRDTVRAALGVADHERYLRDQVEAALARVLSQLPADAFHEDTRTLRDAEAVGDALTRVLKADCAPAGIEVYSAQPTGIEYAPEVAAAMQRCRVAAIDAKHRDGVLTAVVDAVDDTVSRLTARGIVELDAYEHKALVRDLTVAFYTGRGAGEGT